MTRWTTNATSVEPETGLQLASFEPLTKGGLLAQPSVILTNGEPLTGEVVILTCFERATPDAGRLSKRLEVSLSRLGERPGWKAREKQIARTVTGGRHPVLVEVHGLGPRGRFDASRLEDWLQRVLDESAEEGRREITLVLPNHEATRGRQAFRVLLQLLQSGYRFGRFRRRSIRPILRRVYLVPPAGEDEVYAGAMKPARSVSRAAAWTRNLGNTPPNEATPVWMADQAIQLAEKWQMDCRVLDAEAMQELGMGGILAVGGGSANPPRLVRLEWGEGEEVISFVGKGVTFDTGGISIKPSEAMEEMKYDKCGACAVLGVSQAIAELGLEGRFRAYLPFVENMPDGASYRPADIVRCYNGKTVEILNTDAEGRMILADALAWAAAEKPGTLIELSTLTGASVIALGHQGAALYTPDDSLAEELLSAGLYTGDRLWRMPLWREFADEMQGVHADLRNLGSRWGGANNAAAFLGNFVGNTRRWAHLDIAATAYRASRESKTSGATGFGVALLIDWLMAR